VRRLLEEYNRSILKAAEISYHDSLIRQIAMFDEWIAETEETIEAGGSISQYEYAGLCDWIAHRRRALGELGWLPCDFCGQYRMTNEAEDSSEMFCPPCEDELEANCPRR